ncbi:MAG: hypothetical protein DRO94_03620, partial [Candidatus Altiarchaeales archaeon]
MITYLRSMIAVITGSILYIFMVWAPVIGPLITGFMVGLVSGDNARRGFFTGLFSGILGFSILIYISSMGLDIMESNWNCIYCFGKCDGGDNILTTKV